MEKQKVSAPLPPRPIVAAYIGTDDGNNSPEGYAGDIGGELARKLAQGEQLEDFIYALATRAAHYGRMALEIRQDALIARLRAHVAQMSNELESAWGSPV